MFYLPPQTESSHPFPSTEGHLSFPPLPQLKGNDPTSSFKLSGIYSHFLL